MSKKNSTEVTNEQKMSEILTKVDSFICVMCKQNFKTHKQLVIHFRQHGSNEIDIRGKPMLESTLLKHPLKNTPSFELVECEWCPEAFQSISKAIEHKFRKHRYESTNYFCELCGKLFPLKVALEQHMNTEHKNQQTGNTDKKLLAFKCLICKVGFQTQIALDFHEKCVHAIERRLLTPTICPPPSKKIKMNNSDEIISIYYCHLCGSEYMVKFNLRKHLEDHHTTEQRANVPAEGIIFCKTCEAIFYNKKAYEAHNIHHRPDDLYVTSEEQRQKIVARVDQDFDIRRVPLNVDKYVPPIKMCSKRQQPATSTSTVTATKIKKKSDSDSESLSPVSIPESSDDEILP